MQVCNAKISIEGVEAEERPVVIRIAQVRRNVQRVGILFGSLVTLIDRISMHLPVALPKVDYLRSHLSRLGRKQGALRQRALTGS